MMNECHLLKRMNDKEEPEFFYASPLPIPKTRFPFDCFLGHDHNINTESKQPRKRICVVRGGVQTQVWLPHVARAVFVKD